MAKRKKSGTTSGVSTGGSTPLFPDMDPLLEHNVGRNGDRVVVEFDRPTRRFEMNNEQARLHCDLVSAHRKALNVSARRREPEAK